MSRNTRSRTSTNNVGDTNRSSFVKSKTMLRNSPDKRLIENFMSNSDVPAWFCGNSQRQMSAADNLWNAIRDDTEQGTAHRVYFCLTQIGLSPMINIHKVKFLMKLSKGNDLAFLWFLMEMHYKTPGDDTFSINEQLILTAIMHLDMITTLRELDRILPPGHPSKRTLEKRELQRKSKINRTLESKNLTIPIKKDPNPYFNRLVNPIRYGKALQLPEPDYEVKFRLYEHAPDPNFTPVNESNRWYANYSLRVSERVTHNLLNDIINDVINILPSRESSCNSIEADLKTQQTYENMKNRRVQCKHHKMETEQRRLLKLKRLFERQEKIMDKNNMPGGKKVRLQRILASLNSEIETCRLHRERKMRESCKDKSYVRVIGKGGYCEYFIEDTPCIEPIKHCAEEVICEETKRAEEEAAAAAAAAAAAEEAAAAEAEEAAAAAAAAAEAKAKAKGKGKGKGAETRNSRNSRNSKEQRRSTKPGKGGGRMRGGTCDNALNGAASSPIDCNGNSSALAATPTSMSLPVAARGPLQQRISKQTVRASASAPTHAGRISGSNRLSFEVRRKSRSTTDNVAHDATYFPHTEHSSDTPNSSQRYFEAPSEHKPYQFNYEKIFHYKYPYDDKLLIRKICTEALDGNVHLVKKLPDRSPDVAQVAAECAEKTYGTKLQDWRAQMRSEEESLIEEPVDSYPPDMPRRDFYDCNDEILMHDMLRIALEHMRKNPKFVLASLPNVHKLPHLREWIYKRYGKRYTKAERIALFEESVKILNALIEAKMRISVPDTTDVSKGKNVSYNCLPHLLNKVKEVKEKYYNDIRKRVLEQSRICWFAMRAHLCSGGSPHNTFYAYMPSRYSDIQLIHPWRRGEYTDAAFIRKQRMRRAGVKPN